MPLLLLVAMRRRKLDVHGRGSVVTNHAPEKAESKMINTIRAAMVTALHDVT